MPDQHEAQPFMAVDAKGRRVVKCESQLEAPFLTPQQWAAAEALGKEQIPEADRLTREQHRPPGGKKPTNWNVFPGLDKAYPPWIQPGPLCKAAQREKQARYNRERGRPADTETPFAEGRSLNAFLAKKGQPAPPAPPAPQPDPGP